MKRTLKQTLITILLSNAGALAVFYLMYKFGTYIEMPLVQQFYIIPLTALIGYLAADDYKELKKVQATVM